MAAWNEKSDKYLTMFYAIPIPSFTASPLEETSQAEQLLHKQIGTLQSL